LKSASTGVKVSMSRSMISWRMRSSAGSSSWKKLS